ncbi:DUF1643 domain-containing protein [Tropicimonas sp. IMCC34043]|uniref:DUF1643 domain-containing protein n=1 Tax=Tropicimonas sp. IMCC34043 TaxID=2248760 RepID=UPI000E2630FE|nr:DUF1643 domain-containing protein [Tropicimonas sp. IMCC34043]
MITRRHVRGDAVSTAVYSDCGAYRYALTRVWAPDAPRLLYVMLNPSTATEERNDPTIERCERRARALGYGGLRACNLFALRATDPRDLRAASAPVGPDNDAALRDAAIWADAVLCAWGVHGAHRGRDAEVAALLGASNRPLLCLGTTQAGLPRHPLYVGYAVAPVPWRHR